MSSADVSDGLGADAQLVGRRMDALCESGQLRIVEFSGKRFYALADSAMPELLGNFQGEKRKN